MNEPNYERDDMDRRTAGIEAERERRERFAEGTLPVKIQPSATLETKSADGRSSTNAATGQNTIERAAIVMQQIDAILARITLPDGQDASRTLLPASLRCLKTAIKALLPEAIPYSWRADVLVTLCDQWDAERCLRV